MLAYLDYKSDSFFTKISIALKIGTLWSQATKLDTESEFQIYTSDTTASVRWTVFWVSKNSLWSNRITVNTWKVAVSRIVNSGASSNFESLVSKISQGATIEKTTFNVPWITTRWYEWNVPVSYIEVPEWQAPLSVELKTDWGVTSEWVTQPLEDKSFSNGIPLKIQYISRSETWSILNVSLKSDFHFKWTDKIVQNNENFQNAYTLSDVTHGYYLYFVNIYWVYLKTPVWVSTFSAKICRTEKLCTQTLTIPMVELQKITEWETEVCNGVKIESHCIKNELSASGYTLVWVADYTRKDGTLYTFNGGKISGGYTGSALTSDGYNPKNVTTLTGWIHYDLSKLIDKKEFVMEMMVKGEGFSWSTTRFLLYQNSTSNMYIYNYLWVKFSVLWLNNSWTIDMWQIYNSDTYKVQLVSRGELKTLKLFNKYWNTLSHIIINPNSYFDSFNFLYIGRKPWYFLDWNWNIRWLRLYKLSQKVIPNIINNSNQINLKK